MCIRDRPNSSCCTGSLAFLYWRYHTVPVSYTHLEHYTPLIGAQQVRYMVDKFQSPGAVKQQIHDGYRYYFLCWDQQIAGYTAVHPEKDSMFLSKIYVDRAFRNLSLIHI